MFSDFRGKAPAELDDPQKNDQLQTLFAVAFGWQRRTGQSRTGQGRARVLGRGFAAVLLTRYASAFGVPLFQLRERPADVFDGPRGHVVEVIPRMTAGGSFKVSFVQDA